MAIELPAAQKVHTHVYDNFKGVDFTNDATNVWHRRSPDGYNMLPDDSGRPFKRTGWEVVVTAEQLATALSVESAEILKCYYFELAGIDHVIIFANGGVFVYRQMEQIVNGETVTVDGYELLSTDNGYASNSTDIDCYASYDRAFFFEGNGIAAFYIYGNYKVWVYGYEDGEFYFKQATDGFNAGEITIPTLLITTDPSTCAGVMYDSYNLLGTRAAVEYQSNDMCYAYSTGELTVEVDRTAFTTKVGAANRGTYTFTYSSSNWTLSGSNVTLSDYGITYNGTPADNDTIVVKYITGILLPNNVSQQQLQEVEVYGTDVTQFDRKYPPILGYDQTLTAGTCRLMTDIYSQISGNAKAWIEFYDPVETTTSSEDIFKVVFPTKKVDITTYPDDLPLADKGKVIYTGSASINIGG